VKDGVKTGEVRDVGEARHGMADDLDGWGIVERREDDGLVEVAKDLIGDSRVAIEFWAGVHDAVAHGADLRQPGLRYGSDDLCESL